MKREVTFSDDVLSSVVVIILGLSHLVPIFFAFWRYNFSSERTPELNTEKVVRSTCNQFCEFGSFTKLFWRGRH